MWTFISYFLIFVLVLVFGLLFRPKPDKNNNGIVLTKKKLTKLKEKTSKNKKTSSVNSGKEKEDKLLAAVLKGHTDDLLDYDLCSTEDNLISCSLDNFLLIWSFNDILKPGTPLRLNLSDDYAQNVKFSPDNKAFVIHLYQSNNLRVYAYSKKAQPKSYSFINLPKNSESKIINFDIATNGLYILSFYENKKIHLISFKGSVLYEVNDLNEKVQKCVISPCSRIFTTQTILGLSLWKVTCYTNDKITNVEQSINLAPNSIVCDSSFSLDATNLGLVKEDGSWQIYSYIDVKTGKIKDQPTIFSESITMLNGHNMAKNPITKSISSKERHIAKQEKYLGIDKFEEKEGNHIRYIMTLAQNSSHLAIAKISPKGSHEKSGIYTYDTLNGKIIDKLYETESHEDGSTFLDEIIKMQFINNDKYLLIANQYQRRIMVLHNITNLKLRLKVLNTELLAKNDSDFKIEKINQEKDMIEAFLQNVY